MATLEQSNNLPTSAPASPLEQLLLKLKAKDPVNYQAAQEYLRVCTELPVFAAYLNILLLPLIEPAFFGDTHLTIEAWEHLRVWYHFTTFGREIKTEPNILDQVEIFDRLHAAWFMATQFFSQK